MRSAQAGDSAAYARLLAAATPIIRGVVRRHWSEALEPEDLVQDILLALHQVRHTYDPDRPFLPWLLVLARNRLIDIQRRDIRRRRIESTIEAMPETFRAEESNWDATVNGVDGKELRAAIAKLPDGQRTAVELLKLGELSLKEAGEKSGMSTSALKTSMHRALKTLTKLLAGPST